MGNEHRGNDASGIAIQQKDGSLNILKKDCPGWQLVTSDEYTKFIKEHLHADSRGVIVHARGASQGNPRDNNNNHPMYAGVSAVIHNGVIRNDNDMFNILKLDRKAATDSDIIRAIVDRFGVTEQAVKTLGKLSGSGAIAAFDPRYPGKLLLVRSGNPLTLASNDDFLYFSSEKATLHKACRPFVKRLGLWFHSQKTNVDFSTMANNTAYIIGKKGLEVRGECKICTGEYHEPWRKTYEEYGKRQEKWDNMAQVKPVGVSDTTTMKSAYCYQCKKNWVIPKDALYSNYSCNKAEGGCGGCLWQPIDSKREPLKIYPLNGVN